MYPVRPTVKRKVLRLGLAVTFAVAAVAGSLGVGAEQAAAGGALTAALAGMNVYFGSLHGHTAYSDGEGTPQQTFIWARDDLDLDFYAITDHGEGLDGTEWADTGNQAAGFTRDGQFVALRGFEWSSDAGHACVYDTAEFTSSGATPRFVDFYSWLDSRNGIAQFNHPLQSTLFNGFEISATAADNFCAIETGNWVTGNNDGAFPPNYPVALNKGWRLGASYGWDNHSLTEVSGRTAVIAPNLSRPALLDALRQRRFYSTDDPGMQVAFKLGEAWMGSVVQTGTTLTFSVAVTDDENIAKLELISDNGDVATQQTFASGMDSRQVSWSPTVNIARPSYFYLRVTELDTNHEDDDGLPTQTAITSPIWVNPVSSSGAIWYLAEGYTGDNFQEYLSLANPQDAAARATITYMLGDGSTVQRIQEVPAGSRATINVNAAVGAGKEVSAFVMANRDIVVERPIYFNYGGLWNGGHVVLGTGMPSATWYFAEGYTGAGFDDYICLQNPGFNAATLTLRFQTQEEGEKVIPGVFVAGHSRRTLRVNDLFTQPYQMSLKIESDTPVVAERPMYFDYLGCEGVHWEGGSCVMGARQLSTSAYFAEGTTRTGFDEYLTLQNPGSSAITITAAYQLGAGQGGTVYGYYRVEAGRRATVFLPDELEREKDVSVQLTSAALFLAERPMYFDYAGSGDSRQGGHCTVGATAASTEWFFAEGYTGSGFDEYLCLQNPGATDAWVEVDYYTQEQGPLAARMLMLPASTRVTILVNDHAGTGLQNSCRIRVANGPPVVVERPMYFNFGGWDGGSDTLGFVPG